MPQHRSVRHALVISAVTVAAVGTVGTAVPTATASAAPAPARAMSATQFFDGFDGPQGVAPSSAVWAYQTGGNWGGGTVQAYTNRTSNAALTGRGSLLITARGETYTGWDKVTRDYTSARLMSKQSVLYGTISARIRMTGSKGAWPAFWTMGANYAQVRWPACGELDVMESTNNLSALYGSFHGPVANGYPGQAYNAGKGFVVQNGLGNDWHVYSATWRPQKVTFSLDGVPYVTVNRADLPAGNMWAMDNPQNIILNVAVGGTMAGTPAAPADFNATMEVDWVRVVNTTVR